MATTEPVSAATDRTGGRSADDPTAAGGPTGGEQADSGRQTPRALLMGLLRPYRGRLAGVLVLQAVGALAGLAPLLAVVELGRELLAPGPADHGAVWTAVVIGAAGLLARVLFTAAAGGVGHLVDAELHLSLRRTLAERLGRVPLGWYTHRSSGEVNGVVQGDVDTLHHLIAHTPGEFATAVVVPVASLAYLAWVDWRLTLVALVPVLLGLAVHRLLSTEERRRQGMAVGRAMGRIGASSVEFVQGISVVKTFGGAGRVHQRYRRAADDFADFFLGYVADSAGLAALSALVLSPPFVLLLVLTGGTALITQDAMPAADLPPFLLLSVALTAPVAALGHGMDNIHAAEDAAERIQRMLSVRPLPRSARPAAPRGNRVEYRGVDFAYDAGHPVLHGVDLVLEPGTHTALVGPSGAGKSTLAQLLPRFFDPTRGAVLLGGVDIRDIPDEQLYQRVAFIFQDVRLLRATIAENIALAVPDADRSAIEAAARAAGLHERVQALAKGYDSVIGEDTGLSGGEAQRLGIARALLIDAPVLVLDEAMSFADVKTETEIRHALDVLCAGRTRLVVAHRLETVTRADRVVVMTDGRITESGTYQELLAAGGWFAQTWQARQGDGNAPQGGPLR
ncbi:ATP-binding cassette subfamily B protein [Streptomyces sp. BK208]|uniref:ABC transporter ATP-binding protein n=1 Tax=Streptomyces sp. BK208 TaxID=2512150 RepID=UPI00105BCF76|nr:ABC transporter ATP-binding protein [Streptomyces sp. BK208]TDT42711.1 ATP-binding cassette subfamily B protein [Streptomyces sp. BK208]